MTHDEHTTNRPTPGGSAFQETGMDDYLTRVAEAVRAACFEACNENGGDMGAICTVDLPAVIASVPRPEPVAWIIDWPDEPELGHYLAERPSRAGRSRQLYAEPVAAQPAVPDGWKMVPVEPTDRMLDAMVRALSERGVIDAESIDADYAYRAMLATAPEAPQTIQCNACDWIGSSDDARYLGGRSPLGPLCPECGETTGPAMSAADYEAVIAEHHRLVRKLDIALHGDEAAQQASLCDLVRVVTETMRQHRNQDALIEALVFALRGLLECYDDGAQPMWAQPYLKRSYSVLRSAKERVL